MLTHRVAHLVETGGVRPDACLVLTFTRRAAGELKQRLDELLPGQGSRVRVCTFHALACALLREFHREAGLPEAFAVLDERGHLLLLERALGITRAQARSLTERLSRARRDGSLPRDPELLRQATLRQAALSASGQLAFDDLVPGATRLLVEHPELAERLRQRWRHVSVDEYQDVDSAQVALLRLLVGPESSLCAIGDPRQAIYGFRGSDPACFQRFELDFEGAERRRLRRNYRSGRPIVGAANALMRESAVEAPMQPASTLAALPVVRVEAPSAAAEAGAVVHLIEGLLGGLAFFSRDSGRLAEHGFEGLSLDGSRSLAEIAVLFRAESVAEDLVQALDRAGLPFQRRRHGRLMDDERFASLVERLRSLGAGMPLLERLELACMEAARDLEGEEGVALRREQLLVLVRAHPEPASFFEAVELADEADTFDPRADRIALLTLHAAKGLEFSVVFLLGCEEGVLPLHWGREGEEGGEGGEDANDSIEEERRLFYVGMTRARERLFLCRAARRAWRGPPRDMAPSRFLRVLPDEFVTRWRPVGSTTGRLEPDRQLRLFP
jgi:DNA helicase-2/ATP-dependent DNA helicase PcrA